MNIEDEFVKLLEACNPAQFAIHGRTQIEAQLVVLMTEYARLQQIEESYKELTAILYTNHTDE